MAAIAIIPARYASTRFPGKPLANQTGKFLIQHVCEQVSRCRSIDRTVVATDDPRVIDAVKSFGGDVHLTRADHISGTDRVAEVVEALGLGDNELVLNVQGDEPEIDPGGLQSLIERMEQTPAERIGTLAVPFDRAGPKDGPGSPIDPNCVKVVTDGSGRALYFSRSVIPYPRETGGAIDDPSRWLLHLGVYAFRAGVLPTITGDRMPVTALEETESLEQLRWLEAGLSIAVVRVSHRSVGVDTPEDYAAFVARFRATCEDNRAVV